MASRTLDVMKQPHTERRIRSFVRRAGRITKAQQRGLEQLWPRFGVDLGPDSLDVVALFGSGGPVVLDIGFGDGEALLELAKRYPEVRYLGVEVYEPGIGHLLLKLEAAELANVRVICADAADVLSGYLTPGCLTAVNLFFPDPWPKKRHSKRRLVQESFIEDVERVLVPGGLLYIATDWLPYAEHVRAVMSRFSGGFEEVSQAELADEPLSQRPQTKFEQRGLALGHQVKDLYYRKN